MGLPSTARSSYYYFYVCNFILFDTRRSIIQHSIAFIFTYIVVNWNINLCNIEEAKFNGI